MSVNYHVSIDMMLIGKLISRSKQCDPSFSIVIGDAGVNLLCYKQYCDSVTLLRRTGMGRLSVSFMDFVCGCHFGWGKFAADGTFRMNGFIAVGFFVGILFYSLT